MDSILNTKRIAKNTLMLYVRMFLTMGVALYTSRIVLSTLGVEDYGIYNVVGGVVVAISFLNGALNTTSSRFITVSLTKNDENRMTLVFSNILFVNIIIGICVIALGESIGLWLLLSKLQIPENRLFAAHCVYQISLLTAFVNIISVPYNAAIIAHERMKAFAYISLLDAFLKLFIVFLLSTVTNVDKLILYAVFIFIVQITNRAIYSQYCMRSFIETRCSPRFNKDIFKDVFKFISWSSYGSFVSIGFTQGLNILLNIFYGAKINAARAISVQIQSAVLKFITNFQTAINPQLIKSVANNENENVKKILFASSKYSFFLLCLLSLPIVIYTELILGFWLKDVPSYTVVFTQIILITSMWNTLANPLRVINQADGDIKKFQLYECSTLLLILPLSYLALHITDIPESVFIVHLTIELLAQIIRIKIVLSKIKVSIKEYVVNIYFRIVPVFFITLVLGGVLKSRISSNFQGFVIGLLLLESIMILLIYVMGISKEEKKVILSVVSKKLNRW